jgi:hypothetical protein
MCLHSIDCFRLFYLMDDLPGDGDGLKAVTKCDGSIFADSSLQKGENT